MEQKGSEDTKANAGAPTEQKARKSLSGLAVRTAYGLGYAAIFIGCLALGRYTTAIWVAIMSVLCCFEFYRMMRRDGKVPNEQLGLVAAALFSISALLRGEVEIGVMFLLMLAVGLWYVWSPRTRLADVAVTFFGRSTRASCSPPSCWPAFRWMAFPARSSPWASAPRCG